MKEEEKKVFKTLSRGAKAQYIWDYYRWHIIITVCVIAAAIALIVHYATYKDTVLDIIMVNINDPYSDHEAATDDFFAREGFSSADEKITLDTSITYSEDDAYSTNYYSDQNLTLKLSVGGSDILFAPEFVYTQYADGGSMMPLSQFLSEDELAEYEDILVYATDSETGEKVACGVELKENDWLSQNGFYDDAVCFGVVYGASHQENAADFFRYVLGMEQK